MLPEQLKKKGYRFYKVMPNGKLPIEKRWNTENNYAYDDYTLIKHILNGGNYGVVTGFNNLIVIDFDDKTFFEKHKHRLRPTFVVQTAKKRLYHYYYLLKDEMIKSIVIKQHNKTMADIQCRNKGVVAPGSCINDKYYTVMNNNEINSITIKELYNMLPINTYVKHEKMRYKSENKTIDIKEIKNTENILELLKIKKTNRSYKCPFHEMKGKGNLTIMPNGWLYCFHEQKVWKNVKLFFKEVIKWKKIKNV